MTANTDPRAVRTREKLIGAFHEAIRESDPRDMSVSALARAAGVNRTSFYEHFASPEDPTYAWSTSARAPPPPS
jgi:AcrR family transcriptional regulator